MFAVIKLANENLTEKYSPSIFNFFYESFPEGFIIAEKNHKINGFIIGVKNKEDIVRILMLAVNKENRRKKIGSLLLNRLIQNILEEPISRIELEVRIDNQEAIKFYQKHGFEIIDEIKNFYQNGESAYTMTKKF